MRVTDLMVGDWVEDGYKKSQVTSITCDGIVETTAAISNIEVVDPIPLTEEILVKNGWRKHIMLYKNEWYGDIGLFEEHGKFYYMDLKIEYVHQLQHLLRLCGIEKELTI